MVELEVLLQSNMDGIYIFENKNQFVVLLEKCRNVYQEAFIIHFSKCNEGGSPCVWCKLIEIPRLIH